MKLKVEGWTLELHQMEYFIAVCDYGGVTPAAEALFLTPQALSKSIHKLEKELDAPLFCRNKSGLALTPFGEKALAEIRRLVDEYHTAALRLGQISAQEKGLIRLSCGWGVPNALPLDDLREDFLSRGVRLDVMELPDLVAEEMIRQEAADLGLTIGPPQAPEVLQSILLRRFHLCAVVNKRHPYANRASLSVRDLAGEPLITKNALFNSYHTVEQEARQQGVTLSYALQSPNEIRFLQLMEENAGVGIGVTGIGMPKLSLSDCCVLLPFEEELPWDVYLTTRKGHYLSPTAQELLARLRSWQESPCAKP